ncbi:MAG: chromosome partitioning protein [Candidatus Krumholzibacteriia bacterium]|jgi:chromosome partitioning protein
MRVVAVANQKGGCGKTTATTNLAAALVQQGKRVLLVDNDPQGHATLAFGVRERDFSLSTYDLYLSSDILVEDACLVLESGLHLIPAGIELSAVEMKLARERAKEMRLSRCFERSEMPYDYVLIDCPPSVSLLTFNALLASSEVLIPVDPSHYSLQAVRKMRETLAVLRDQKDHDLVPHILMSDFDTRPKFVRKVMEELDELYSNDLLDAIIHHTVRFKEAASAGIPVLQFDPESRGAYDFQRLATEIVSQEVTPQAVMSVSAKVDPDQQKAWPSQLSGPEISRGGVNFKADFPRAKSVRITGTFCDWSAKGAALQRNQDGTWKCKIDLDSGSHEYRYIVDGAWLPDPHNTDTVANEFGGANSRVIVK